MPRFCTIKVAREEDLRSQIGHDGHYFDLVDFSRVRVFQVVVATPISRFKMVFGASTLAARARGGLYQGSVLDICHIIVEAWFDQAAEYWKQAITLTPGNYIEAQNWLKNTKRFELLFITNSSRLPRN